MLNAWHSSCPTLSACLRSRLSVPTWLPPAKTQQLNARCPLSHLCPAVRTCNECFLQNVAWDSSRTYDVFGPADGKPVVLVHGALIGRQCMVLEAKALAEAGYRYAVCWIPALGSSASGRRWPLAC